jgi:HlyD family secretion protein
MQNIFKDKKISKWQFAILAMAAVALAWAAFLGAGSANAAETQPAQVVALNMDETVEATGALETRPFASLAWKTSGVVESINVETGDFVKAGDALLTLQPESASASLVSALADLETAKANLNAIERPDGASVGAARENVSSAFNAWNAARVDLVDELAYNRGGGDDELYSDVIKARDDLVNALEEYPLAANTEAQFYYWASRAESLGYIGEYEYAALTPSLRDALDKEDLALVDDILATQTKFESLAKAFAESMNDHDDAVESLQAFGVYEQAADALLDAMESQYGVLVAPSESDLISARAKADSAQASVNNLYIVAPFDGQVLSVEHRPGDTVTSGELSVNLADLNQLYVETQIDESDIAKIKAGNQAEVTLDALPDVVLTGKVTSINPVGEVVSGMVKYKVRVELDKVEEGTFLPLGTTANVTIKVKDAAAVLAVPITAIQNDSNGEFVWVMRNDAAARVDVVGGAIVGDLVVVTGDLTEGETLQIVNESSLQAPNPFGGSK